MINSIFIASIVIILSIISGKFSKKIGIPSLLLFLGLGLFFGSDGIIRLPFDNYEIVKTTCSIALIFIIFYGGFGTRWETAKPVALQAILISTIGVFITTVTIGLFSHFILKINLMESFLLGAVISSTDAASVFSILKSKKLNLKYQTAPILEVESGSNDPTAYMLTIIILELMNGYNNYLTFIWMIIAQFLIAIITGFLIAKITLYIYNNFDLKSNGLEIIYFFGMILLSFSLPEMLNGNGYLSTYIFGIMVGNNFLKNKTVLINFFDGLTGLMQITIFFLLGLLAFPSQLPSIALIAFAITIFLTFIARPLAIYIILKPFGSSLNQIALISFSGIRGASSIVFAIVAMVNPAYLKNDIFHIVLCIVLISIAFQGSLLPYVAKKLKMIDENDDVLKTFTDYQDEKEIQLIRLRINGDHPWKSLRIMDLELPPQLLIVTIIRDDNAIVPSGNSLVLERDIIIIAAPGYQGYIHIEVNEFSVNKKHEWINKPIYAIKIPPKKLIAIIKRGNQVIVPNGDTIIKLDDILVLVSKYQ